MQLQNYNIVDIVEQISLSVADFIENRSKKLTFDTDTEEIILACDEEKIERVMLNLLSNAVKFTKEGGTIFVGVYKKETCAQIIVRDDGVGIPDDKKDVLFKRFGQVNSSLTRNMEGSGIGLSLVKSLIELHEGSIRLESTYGEGSEFIIELPLKKIDVFDDNQISDISKDRRIEKVIVEFSDIYTHN